MGCQVTYSGPSHPECHGAMCMRDAPHEGLRHLSVVANNPLQWWTPEEKEAIRAKNREVK